MGKNHQQNNLNRIFGGDCSSAGGGLGSTHCSSGGANEAVGNIYRSSHDVSSSFQSLNSGNISTASLQPLDNFPYSTTRPFKSPGGEMAANFGISFTSAQWKELERQAMIYKCMISSVPVPPDLLFPLSTAADSSRPSLHNGRYSKKWDPEPGRCKRTDGKKWRCSREAAPHQRHCEHHLHRGKRSCSRKPVEMKTNLENHKKTSLQQKNPAVTEPEQQQQPHLFNEKTDPSISADFCHKGTDRDLYAMDGTKDGKYLVEPSMGLENEGSSIYGHNAPDLNIDHMDVFSYSTFPTPKIEYPTGFINSWSIDNFNNTNNGIDAEYSASASDENLSPSLTVSMAIASGDVLDGEMGNIQMMESGIEDNDVDQKSEDLRLLGPVSWEPFGPLAEAMHPPASPYDPVISNPATYNVSSPSEVLHRTSISQYDSSTALDVPQSEVTFHWFS